MRRGAGSRRVAIRDDRIVAVGSEADVRERVGTAEVISGACIVPGFQDAHIHAAFAGRIRRNVNLDDLHDVDDYLERIATYAATHPDVPWIVGGGWYTPVFGGDGPHRRQLDAIVPDRPVFLMNTDTHGAWVNTRALELRRHHRGDAGSVGRVLRARRRRHRRRGCLQEGTAYSFWSDHMPADPVEDWMDVDPRRPAPPAHARHHRAGRTHGCVPTS